MVVVVALVIVVVVVVVLKAVMVVVAVLQCTDVDAVITTLYFCTLTLYLILYYSHSTFTCNNYVYYSLYTILSLYAMMNVKCYFLLSMYIINAHISSYTLFVMQIFLTQVCCAIYCGQTPTKILWAGARTTAVCPSPSGRTWWPSSCADMTSTSSAAHIR